MYLAENIKQIIEQTAKKTGEEVKRHFDVVAEELKGQIRQVAEGVETNTQQLQRMEKQLEHLEPMQDDIEAIKVTRGLMKNDLKQKGDREELGALEERVSRLEGNRRLS